MERLERVMVWRNAEQNSIEYCNLFSDEGNWKFDGTVVMVLAGRPARIRYDIRCDATWATREVNIEMHVGAQSSGLQMTVDYDATKMSLDPRSRDLGLRGSRIGESLDGRDVPHLVASEQRWWLMGKELEGLRGCLDVDLGITPATNTLPIRRLNLRVGASAEIVAAMVTFPDLLIEPARQKYTRLEENHYRYESVGTCYSSELTVDDLGLVTNYAGGWERVAEV